MLYVVLRGPLGNYHHGAQVVHERVGDTHYYAHVFDVVASYVLNAYLCHIVVLEWQAPTSLTPHGRRCEVSILGEGGSRFNGSSMPA